MNAKSDTTLDAAFKTPANLAAALELVSENTLNLAESVRASIPKTQSA